MRTVLLRAMGRHPLPASATVTGTPPSPQQWRGWMDSVGFLCFKQLRFLKRNKALTAAAHWQCRDEGHTWGEEWTQLMWTPQNCRCVEVIGIRPLSNCLLPPLPQLWASHLRKCCTTELHPQSFRYWSWKWTMQMNKRASKKTKQTFQTQNSKLYPPLERLREYGQSLF